VKNKNTGPFSDKNEVN